MGVRPSGHVIDRINNADGYSPKNCRWVTFKKSTENRSNTIWIDGLRVNEVSALLNVPPHRVYRRLSAGWSLDDLRKNCHAAPHGYTLTGEALNPSLNAKKKRAVSNQKNKIPTPNNQRGALTRSGMD